MQQKGQAEINTFVGGLITDASPLTFPPNMSKTDINMDLLTDGSRKRSLGIDLEASNVKIVTNSFSAGTSPTGISTFRWENVGSDPNRNFLCVQVGNEVKFFDMSVIPLSSGLIGTKTFPSSDSSLKYSFASVDGNLVVASGVNTITVVQYKDETLSYLEDGIKVRDFFGVEDTLSGQDLTVGAGLSTRPATLTNAHLYNIRNQGFGIPRMTENKDFRNIVDPISEFTTGHTFIKGTFRYPSNSDTVVPFLYANPNASPDRITKRFNTADSVSNPPGSFRAGQGYFTIDLLNRGTSRNQEELKNRVNFPELTFAASALPEDRTIGGPKVVCEFAGRVWYAGFGGEVVGGDSKSPNLTSYIAFSQLVNDPSMITLCYQAGDPTSEESPDIVDTDGGLIRISNSYDIKAMINLGSDLMIGASNGWWRVFGGNDSGFTGTNYVVSKVSDRGVRGVGSVVVAENTVLYWSDDGIYHLQKNQLGDWESVSLTNNRIQNLYDDISVNSKDNVIGVYDSFQKKVRWLYQNTINVSQQQKELIFSVNLNAFWERHISQIVGNGLPILISNFQTNPYRLSDTVNPVTVLGSIVTAVGSNVTVSSADASLDASLNEVGYMIVTKISPQLEYTFGYYSNTEFVDWKSVNGVGVDAPATLVTGTASSGDNIKYKQMPYIVTHMRRTENGFTTDVNGDFIPINQSSCLLQSQWDWTNSANANKWSVPAQIYRYRRVYMPANINDKFDTGYETIVTKNKLRGRGRALALKFVSEPKKEMHIFGWSMILLGNSGE